MKRIISPLSKPLQPILSTFLILMTLLMGACGNAATTEETHDFQALSKEMQTRKLPLLLAFRADYCTYCRQLESEYLIPMLKSPDYNERIIIRSFSLGEVETITDFNGDTVVADVFAAKHGATLTPTLVFLDSTGKAVAEPLLGYNSPDFYGAYLESAIDTAHAAVQ